MGQLLSNPVFNYISANVFCMAAIAILLFKQLTAFNDTPVQKNSPKFSQSSWCTFSPATCARLSWQEFYPRMKL